MIYLTERDEDLLKDLYLMRVMTVSQIKRLYFSDSRQYVYRRLSMMKKNGLVATIPLLKKRKKKIPYKAASCYYITNKGIQVIQDELEFDGEEIRSEANNIVSKKRLEYQLLVNEIPVELKKSGYKWYDSRRVKIDYNLNRGDLIAGLLSKNNNNYAVYIPNKDDETKKRIETEINRISMQGLTDIIILCPDTETLEKYQELEASARSIMVLPHSPRGLFAVKIALDETKIKQEIQKQLGAEPYPIHHQFAKYIIEKNHREYYITELMTNDLIIKRGLKTYTVNRARNDRPVYILVWKYQLKDIETYNKQPHIRIIYPEHFLEGGV